jgi:hypothetical protein
VTIPSRSSHAGRLRWRTTSPSGPWWSSRGDAERGSEQRDSLGEPNSKLLSNDDNVGSPPERGRTIIDHMPASRFGEPEAVVSILTWLRGPAARFWGLGLPKSHPERRDKMKMTFR